MVYLTGVFDDKGFDMSRVAGVVVAGPVIRWRDEEWKALARSFVVHREDSKDSDTEVFRRAMAALDGVVRQREGIYWSNVNVTLAKYLPTAQAELAAHRAQEAAMATRDAAARTGEPPPPPEPAPDALAPAPATVLEIAPNYDADAHRYLPPEPPSVEDAIVDAIKRVVLRVLRDPDLRVAMVQVLSSGRYEDAVQPVVTPIHTAERVKLPRVAVIGAIGPQINDLKNTYEGRASLRFWSTDEKVQALKPLLDWCECAVHWTGFTGHDSFNSVKASHNKSNGRFRLMLNTNGVTTCKALIDEYLTSRSGVIAGAQAHAQAH